MNKQFVLIPLTIYALILAETGQQHILESLEMGASPEASISYVSGVAITVVGPTAATESPRQIAPT